MNALVFFAIFFGALLAPAQEIGIGQMKDLGGGVFVAHDGRYVYIAGPVGTELRVGDTTIVVDHARLQVVGNKDHWTELDRGVFKIYSDWLGVYGAGEVVVQVRQPAGEFIGHKVENIAGKVTLLPGDVTLVEGQKLHIATAIVGAPSDVLFTAGFKTLNLGKNVRKGTALSGAVVTEYLDGLELAPGKWKINVWCRNSKGVFEYTIHVLILPVQRLVECCPDILK